MELLANAERLKVRSLSRDNAHGAVELARVASMGDTDGEDALLKQMTERARQKRGIKLRSFKSRKVDL